MTQYDASNLKKLLIFFIVNMIHYQYDMIFLLWMFLIFGEQGNMQKNNYNDNTAFEN